MHAPSPGRSTPRTYGPRTILRTLAAYGMSGASRLVPRIISATAGADPNGSGAPPAIYVSHDRWGRVADYVVAQVAGLARAGRRVTFISNSPRLLPHDVARLLPHVREVVHRRNLGHDFGAYKDGIARLGPLGTVASLVLMNDSCFGPFGGLERVEQAARSGNADLFGITDSWSIRYHVQTYYIWIGARVLQSPAFTAFWRALLPVQPRSMVIANGEVRLTQKLLKAGFTVKVLCPYDEVAAAAKAAAMRRLEADDGLLDVERAYLVRLSEAVLAGVDLNPTHSFWDVLLTQCGSPFIKRELLRHNPLRIPGVPLWETTLAHLSSTEIDLIRNNLQFN